MSKKNMFTTTQKRKENKIIKGGYVSSLTGVSQSERAERYNEQKRGCGVHENKKRKSMLKPKHKKTAYNCDSSSYAFYYTA
ncbi:hypothetical protein [uncultured Clostridium sp.]|uniref:hypothetical protein n=1 Tax=uncultured Clostridium sp. TaxID=59620 RepID=UPI0025E38D96|nr:hypothetical protein [uncultured Clostridium sp.]